MKLSLRLALRGSRLFLNPAREPRGSLEETLRPSSPLGPMTYADGVRVMTDAIDKQNPARPKGERAFLFGVCIAKSDVAICWWTLE